MPYDPQHLHRLQAFYREQYGTEISAEEAAAILDRLVSLYRLLLSSDDLPV